MKFVCDNLLIFLLAILLHLSSVGGRPPTTSINYTDNIEGANSSTGLKVGPIDAVYTWVNGSDPQWRKERDIWYQRWIQDVDGFGQHMHNASTMSLLDDDGASDENHYRDNDELRYSIRSLEKYAPWIRQIYLVTNGQIPTWLDRNNSRLRIVTHAEIFENASHLPVFSSSSIESNVDRIPGLSDYFLYFNDDVFLGAHVTPDDFIEPSGAQIIHLSHPVPLSEDAYPEYWCKGKSLVNDCLGETCDRGDCDLVNNGHGDTKLEPLTGKVFLSSACDELETGKLESLIDEVLVDNIHMGGRQFRPNLASFPQIPISENAETPNTRGKMPELGTIERIKIAALLDAFSQCPNDHDLVSDAIRSVIRAFNERFSRSLHLRRVPSHMPHMINKGFLKELKGIFKSQFDLNSAHKFRHPRDLQVSFAYFNYLINRPYFLSATSIQLQNRTLEMKSEGLQSDFQMHKGYKLKMESDVTFHMLGDDHQATMEQLQSTRDHATKFICLNDDMMEPSVDVKLAFKKLLESLWPNPSSLELPATPVTYKEPQKALYPKMGMSSGWIAWGGSFLSLAVMTILWCLPLSMY